jgi:LPXTG-motif cell wall-anchored protein
VLDRSDTSAIAEADAAVVRVKVLDITKTPPVYEEVEVAPGESQTILPDTPLESTITAAGAETSEEEGEARAASDAVSLHLLKGVQGGVQVGLGRTTAGATVAAEPEATKPRQPTSPLPATGGTDVPLLILVLGIALVAGVLVARRVIRH